LGGKDPVFLEIDMCLGDGENGSLPPRFTKITDDFTQFVFYIL